MNDNKLVLTDEAKLAICAVKNKMRITKVVCTRSVKGQGGDNYVGFSAAWDTIQDDAGNGGDLMVAQDGDQVLADHQGMTLKESKVAGYILGMQADIAAHYNAAAGGNIRHDVCNSAIKAIKGNYSRLIAELFTDKIGGDKS